MHWDFFHNLFLIVGLLSIVVGSLGAVYQVRIKRFLAYASMVHIGYMLLLLAMGGDFSIVCCINYLVIYIFTNMLFFASLLLFRKLSTNVEFETLADFKILVEINPVFGLILMVVLFAMVGLPPLAGFLIKVFVFKNFLFAGSY